MMPASVRLSWATRSTDGRGVLALVGAVGAFTFGTVLSAASRNDGSFLTFWCSAVATACLIGVDFPGAGHPRWSEFELSLPVAPLARARAHLALCFAIWLLPSLLAFALSQLGSLGIGDRLPLSQALIALANATAGVVLATALRHSFALRRTLGAAALRLAVAPVMLAAAAARSPIFAAVVLVLAAPLLAIAHRAASRTPELNLADRAEPPVLGPITSPRLPALEQGETLEAFSADPAEPNTFGRMALRYSAGSAYPLMMLGMAALWALGINAGWLPIGASHTALLAMLVLSHAMWSTRLLRLGHLPYSRERLFRFVAWPPLAAIALGLGLSFALPAPDQLLRPRSSDGKVVLQSAISAWHLTSDEPPLVTAPDGESHRPRAHSFGLGTLLTAYDPYEIPRESSKTFQTYQVGRLLVAQRGISLAPEQIEARFASGPDGYSRLDHARHSELRDPAALGARCVGAAVLLLAALVAMWIVVRPGAAVNPNRFRWDTSYLAFFGFFMVTQLYQLATISWKNSPDPLAIALSRLGRPLAESALFVVPVAAGLGLLLYRGLVRRFEQMEPPLRARKMDAWFIEI